MKVLIIVGARPNFMKAAPIISALRENNTSGEANTINYLLVHTGQHYDNDMSDVFFRDLEMPKPDLNLGVGSGTHARQTAEIMISFEKVCIDNKPDLVMVVGDINSTIACALVAAKMHIPVAHVEAGLRSFDKRMPEEINRVLTDRISDILFTTCDVANQNLLREGVQREKIFFVGNVMVDTLNLYKKRAEQSDILKRLGLTDEQAAHETEKRSSKDYGVLTLHRPSNVDEKKDFLNVIEILIEITKKIPVIFPIHPRTKKRIQAYQMQDFFEFEGENAMSSRGKITCIDPLSYLEFLKLMKDARLVLTDSGGIQAETTVLGIPCLTLRENTEWLVTLNAGSNVLTGIDREKIIGEVERILSRVNRKIKIPPLWDGNTSRRIVDVLRNSMARS